MWRGQTRGGTKVCCGYRLFCSTLHIKNSSTLENTQNQIWKLTAENLHNIGVGKSKDIRMKFGTRMYNA